MWQTRKAKQANQQSRFQRAGDWEGGTLQLPESGKPGCSGEESQRRETIKLSAGQRTVRVRVSKSIVNIIIRACDAVQTGQNLDSCLLTLNLHSFHLTQGLTVRKGVCEACARTHGGVQPSSFIHGQESVAVDAFDADDPLRNCKELQDTWMDKHSAMTDR